MLCFLGFEEPGQGGYKLYSTVGFISAIVFFMICIMLIVSTVSLKQRFAARGVHVNAIVTHRWDPSSKDPSGFRESTYRVFAKWTDPLTQKTYHFMKEAHHPLDYREGDIVPATINLEHPWFRSLNV
jgi:hypothetical protein